MYSTKELADLLGLKESSVRNNLYPQIKKAFPDWNIQKAGNSYLWTAEQVKLIQELKSK